MLACNTSLPPVSIQNARVSNCSRRKISLALSWPLDCGKLRFRLLLSIRIWRRRPRPAWLPCLPSEIRCWRHIWWIRHVLLWILLFYLLSVSVYIYVFMMKQHHMFVRAYTSSRVHDVAGRGPLALKPGRPVVQGEHNARGGGEEWWEGTTERGNTQTQDTKHGVRG